MSTSVKVRLAGNPDFDAHPLEVREKAFQMFKQGKQMPEIAELLKVPLGTLRRWSSKGKWRLRVQDLIPGTGKMCPLATDTTNPEVEAIAEGMTLVEKQEHYKEKMATQALRLPKLLETMSDQQFLQQADKIAKADGTSRKALGLEENKPTVVVNVGLLAGALPAKPAVAVLENVAVAGELPAPAPESKDTDLPVITVEPVEEKVEAS